MNLISYKKWIMTRNIMLHVLSKLRFLNIKKDVLNDFMIFPFE